MSRIYILFAIIFTISSPISLVSGVNYGVYMLFLCLLALKILANKVKITFPYNYMKLLFLLWGCMLINTAVSPYTPDAFYVILGVFISSLPFVHHVISFSIKFKSREISLLVDGILYSTMLLCVLVVANSIIEPSVDSPGFLTSSIIRVGFVASSCNQALALSLFRLYQTKRKKYRVFIVFFLLFVVLTIQLKAIAGSMIVLGGYYVFTHNSKGTYVKLTIVGMFCLGILSMIPAFNEKIKDYIEIYTSEGATEGVARNALYLTAGRIAYDYFPFGTGQGTYASVPSKLVPDKVMAEYGIDGVYGLSESSFDKGDFRLDTHWANILGENGVAGTIIYLLLLFYPVRKANNSKNKKQIPQEVRFLITMSIITMFIESFVLPLPNRLNFIFIYSGLSAILLRYVSMKPAGQKKG